MTKVTDIFFHNVSVQVNATRTPERPREKCCTHRDNGHTESAQTVYRNGIGDGRTAAFQLCKLIAMEQKYEGVRKAIVACAILNIDEHFLIRQKPFGAIGSICACLPTPSTRPPPHTHIHIHHTLTKISLPTKALFQQDL